MAADMAAPAHRKPTLIVDNYDSYTHNLYQMCWSVSGVQPILIRNDEEARFQSLLGRAAFDNIIISPGPGSPDRPQDFGICARILKSPPAPVLGVCLGCQGLGWMYGLDVCKAPGGAVHGRKSAVFHNEAERGGGGLFAGIPDGFYVVRYHSLAVVPRPGMPFPEELERTAWTADGVLMGLQHRKLPLWGVQFHPESICTEYGAELLGNFLALADAHNATLEATHSNASTPPSAQPHALESSHGWAYTEESPLRVSSSGSSGASSCGSAGAGATAPMGAGCCDFHGAARGAHEPETCAAASRPLQAATCPPPGCGHRKLKLLHRVLETRLEAETFYMANLSQDERSFWLDSSRREHGVARFSYMGGSTGPLSYQLRYDLPNRTLETTFPSGRKELRDKCDVLEFLEGQLQACKHSGGAAELPFEFRGGFVGYLGYELKELCEDGQGQRNRHISQEPDAVLLFADRFLVWDHQEGHVYVAALVSDGAVAEAEARAWLACTEQEVRRLSSLSLKDTLAARHQAMRDPPPLPVNARGGAVAAEGVAASAQGMSMPAGGQGILVQPLQVGAASGEEQDLQDLASHDMMEDDAPSNEPPTVDADDGEEQEPSHTPAGPGALSFPPVSPTAPSLSAGPGSVPRGAMPHADSEGGKDAVAAASALSSRESGFVSLDSARQYQDKVQQCLGHIVEGESYELCLTTRLRSRRGMRLDPLRFYQRLRAVNPAPYSALLRCGKGLTVCSSSPERFMRISAQGLCDSKPIKGTRRRGSCPEEDAEICRELRKCEKDLAENLMIVDLVRNDLGRVCTQASVCCPKIMDVETYATVHQLVSTIQGQMRPELSRVDVLRATFPMGSMTGAPKRRSLALLDELESDARGIYSGAIGFLSLDGAVHLSVAIRTAVVTDDGVKVGAGGAVTVLSDPEDEWEEMQLKASALVNCAHAVCMSVPAADLAAGAPVA